ncbi:MAG: hypothetical protein GY716_12355 [bacterium]|nr:hypothetical protein [bacterium]
MSKPFTRAFTSAAGISLAEMLVAFAVAFVVTGAAFSLAVSSRGIYASDQSRTALNQNLRAGMDLIGVDLRGAGARLPEDITRLAIDNGDTGESDRLLVRRNLVPVVLPVCSDIPSGSSVKNITIAGLTLPRPAGCDPVADTDGDNWPDNLRVWHDYRLENGAIDGKERLLRAFIWDPGRRRGEFFVYHGENRVEHQIVRKSGRWNNSYSANGGARIYILEEHEFFVTDGILQRVDNGDVEGTKNVIDHVESFQVAVVLKNGKRRNDFGLDDSWVDLQSVEVRLFGRTESSGVDLDRRLVSRFLPRNVLN